MNVPIFTEGSTIGAQTYPEVLHDDITNTLGAFYPATTPSFTEYYYGTGSVGTGSFYVFGIQAPGTGYAVGDVLTIVGYGSVTVLAVGVANSVLQVTQPTPPPGVQITGGTFSGTFAGGGGAGSGAMFNVFTVSYNIPTPGTAWVGNERPIAADVKQTDIPNLWKVVIESVVMR